MINITINNEQYKVYEPNRWDEMTIDKAIELASIEIPLNLLAIYNAATLSEEDRKAAINEIEFTHNDHVKDFPAYYGRCMEVMTDIPVYYIARILGEERTALYKEYIEWFVIRLINSELIENNGVKDFKHKKITYYLPKSEEVLGTLVPAYETTAIEFTEASNILAAFNDLQEGDIEAIKTIIAIYCRPKGEKYNELTSINRAVEFGQLPMLVANEVFFCIVQFTAKYATDTLTSQAVEILKDESLLNRVDSTLSDGLLRYLKSARN